MFHTPHLPQQEEAEEGHVVLASSHGRIQQLGQPGSVALHDTQQ
jgi:hypothetical protein